MPNSKHPIEDHAQWALTMWMGGGTQNWSLRDHAVMSLGLAGEALEVLEVAFAEGEFDQDEAKKELGDAIYYWCIACGWAGASPKGSWPKSPEPSAHIENTQNLQASCAKMCISFGKASESAKKIIRDSDSPERLKSALEACAASWCDCCAAMGLDWREVLLTNKNKLEGRMARGTLAGSGNNR